jgi:hypothetical protein
MGSENVLHQRVERLTRPAGILLRRKPQAREPQQQVCRAGRRKCVGEGIGINGFAIEE